MAITTIHGSAHDTGLEDKSVHCGLTSPPYWNQRAYADTEFQLIPWPEVRYRPMPGLPEIVIPGCDPDCAHEWADVPAYKPNQVEQTIHRGANKDAVGAGAGQTQTRGAYCSKCGGWRGGLGSEPTIEAYIGHLILCAREWRRVLRDDGTMWVNLGDSYANDSKWGGRTGGKHAKDLHGQAFGRERKSTGLKTKEMCGVPWRFAFAAQADGWYLRSDVIWAKPNAMPSSVTDRPTMAHEYIFLLSKKADYFYDQVAVKEKSADPEGSAKRYELPFFQNGKHQAGGYSPDGKKHTAGMKTFDGTRNRRSVWTVATRSYSGSHFATWPEELAEIMIKAGTSAKGVCPECGAPWERLIRRTGDPDPSAKGSRFDVGKTGVTSGERVQKGERYLKREVGWQATCTCFGHFEEEEEEYLDVEGDQEDGEGVEVAKKRKLKIYVPHCEQPELVPATVFDPFVGSGTTLRVAERLGRDSIGVDVSLTYLDELVPDRVANVQQALAF